MMGRKAFLMKPMHQCHLSQWGECIYGAQSWKKGNYYMHPCLSQLKNNIDPKEMVERKSFLLNPKHQYHPS